jgi:hypothetical protein
MPNCEGCGAEIIWGVTAKGKRTPLDAKAEKRYVEREVYELDDDQAGTFYRAQEQDYVALVDTFMPHFATCPRADSFRRSP